MPWNPNETYAGDSQYDARLDKPVQFWGAGMRLTEVFAGIKKQTGVETAVYPPGFDMGRMCVTLYLNPQKPPTLHALLVQLGWATNSSFATVGHGGETCYFLLATPVNSDVTKLLRREAEESDATWRSVHDTLERETYERMWAKLAELPEALALSREEAVRRYRGREDTFLCTLLDPRERLTAKLLLSFPDSVFAELRRKEDPAEATVVLSLVVSECRPAAHAATDGAVSSGDAEGGGRYPSRASGGPGC